MPEQHDSYRPDPEFLERISNEVHHLFFLSAVNMERFKAQVRAAIKYQKRHDDARAELDRREAELERREQEHSEKVKRDARLRDQKAGPPKDGWEWNEEFPFEDGAWVPPELARKSDLPPRPIPSGLCPPDIPWEIGLPGRYVILGIVHDNSDRARRHYRPELLKGFDLPLAFRVYLDQGAGSGTGEMGFADFDRESIERALIDVKADLASQPMQPGGGKTARPPKAEKPINPTLQKAAAYIRRHHGSNAAQIAKHCGVEPDTIRNLAKNLKKMGFTSRRGCNGGYWPTAAAK